MPEQRATFLNRYTSLPVLLDILVKKRITLISPDCWEDKNDNFFVEAYRKRLNLRTVLGVCFSSHRETFHHWKVFAPGMSGVCIEFSRRRIEEKVAATAGFRSGDVSYHLINGFDPARHCVEDLPFLKRKPYMDEREFRILFTDAENALTDIGLDIELDWIHHVTLSPNLPEPLCDSVKEIIRFAGFAQIDIRRSTLLENERWKNLAGEIG